MTERTMTAKTHKIIAHGFLQTVTNNRQKGAFVVLCVHNLQTAHLEWHSNERAIKSHSPKVVELLHAATVNTVNDSNHDFVITFRDLIDLQRPRIYLRAKKAFEMGRGVGKIRDTLNGLGCLQQQYARSENEDAPPFHLQTEKQEEDDQERENGHLPLDGVHQKVTQSSKLFVLLCFSFCLKPKLMSSSTSSCSAPGCWPPAAGWISRRRSGPARHPSRSASSLPSPRRRTRTTGSGTRSASACGTATTTSSDTSLLTMSHRSPVISQVTRSWSNRTLIACIQCTNRTLIA